ncbi:MAG: aminoglycoside phosphotransferase family protein [Planctomycetota bacterium]
MSGPTETEADAPPVSSTAGASTGERDEAAAEVALPPIGWASNHAVGSVGGLGESLGRMLVSQLSPRLGPVHAFRTEWQRGGALTGYAKWSGDGGTTSVDVVVKVPVPPCEVFWLTALQDAGVEGAGLVPRVYASGEAVGGYDLAWVVMEKIEHGPINGPWGGAGVDLLIEALAAFHASAEPTSATHGKPVERNWSAMIERSRKVVSDGGLPEAQRWKGALKKAKKRAAQWQAAWDGRSVSGWCHGDFHAANVMSRSAAPGGPGVLIDFAQTRPGHWLEDAVYYEHQHWATPDRLEGRQPCKRLAETRRAAGQAVDGQWAELAAALRAYFAIAAPQTLGRRHGEAHLAAALGVLERVAAGQTQ